MLRNTVRRNNKESELDLYFLIAQYLSQGPCQDAAKTLIKELEQNGLLHRNLDWTGNGQRSTFEHSLSTFRDVAPNYLFQMCQTLLPNDGSSASNLSLCQVGKRSLLHNTKDKTTQWGLKSFSACVAGKPLVPSRNFTPSPNFIQSILGREMGGSKYKNLLRPVKTLYGKMNLHRRVLGHLSSVYCILFDRTGQRIFTGSDDCLLKCWSTNNGRLLSTFRGHQSEICDMDISYENNLLASASCDREIRIWDTRNGKPITILQSHSAMITSVEFSALIQGDTRYLISTGRDGNVCFWIWNAQTLEFCPQPNKFHERNRPGVAMLCSSSSAGGRFIAVGGSDNLVHIYNVPFENNITTIGPVSVAEQDEHTNTVDSIWFSHGGLRFISGSKDGTARVWTFESSTWTSLVLEVSRNLDSPLDPMPDDATNTQPSTSKSSSKTQANNSMTKQCVIMVSWDCCDENVMTSLTDFSIKVWNSRSRKLISILKGHTDEAYCLEPHPSDKRIFLSAGHDGNVFLWDVTNGNVIMNFHNMLEGLGHGAVFDAKFSRDGSSFACTDSHGHLLLFGYGGEKAFLKSPIQQFFHTDYRPLIRDQQGYVLDEQTQQAPHLMPPPFLVDVDGNPYPPELQRLVPGRETLNTQQLVPNFITEENGVHIIDVESVPLEEDPTTRAVLDGILDQMQHQEESEGQSELLSDNPPPFLSPSSAVGLRREGDLAGVRQMHRNAPRSQLASVADIMALTQRVLTQQYTHEENDRLNSIRKKKGLFEVAWHRRESRKKRSSSHRRQSRDFANQSSSHSKNRDKFSRLARQQLSQGVYKEDDDEDDSSSQSRQLRLLAPLRTNDHGYSTRSSAPRRRMSSVAEIVHENGDIDEEEMEEHFSSETGETSAFTSSEEDFSQKAKIIRRSKRKKKSRSNRHDNIKNIDEIEINGLRRSSRHRRVPKKLAKSSSNDEYSSAESERNENTASTSSLFESPRVRKSNRTKHKDTKRRRKRQAENENFISSDEEQTLVVVDDETPSTSKCQENVQSPHQPNTSCANSKPQKREIIALPYEIVPGQPPPAMYLPPDWVTRVTPCHFPYIPQIDDEIIYLRQGHELYITKVINEKVWDVNEDDLCYNVYPHISGAEVCRVIEIEYRVGPPTLCEVFLRPINRKFYKKSVPFTVKFHDMPNVVDFLILKDKYDISVKREWEINHRFRSIIDDSWWYGVIMSRRIHDPAYPDSEFQSFAVVWDTDNQEDIDYLSPWDMEAIPENATNLVRTRSHDSASTSVTSNPSHSEIGPKELCTVISYKLKSTDWGCDIEDFDITGEAINNKSIQECNRITQGIQQLLAEKDFSSFATPVDVVSYPAYPLYVSFPTDLSTMLQRLQHNFYRRSTALQWEISCLEKNARVFNEPDSAIVKRAEFLCQIMKSFILNKTCTDVQDLLHSLDGKSSSEEDNSDINASSSGGESTRIAVSSESDDIASDHEIKRAGDSRDISEYATTAGEDEEVNIKWIDDAKNLLNEVLTAQDSRPFRTIVKEDEDEISLDLNSIKNKLLASEYKDPKALRDDILLMFSNYKNSNPERIGRSMMARLSPLMKSRIDSIISEWKKLQMKRKNDKKMISLRRSTRNRRRQDYYDSRSQSSRFSQDSDWVSESKPRRTTRQSMRKHSEVTNIVNENSQNCRRSQRQSHRKSRAMRLQTVDSDDNETIFTEKAELDESDVVVENKRALKRQLSDTEEIGQGDAPLVLRCRKKPRLNLHKHYSSEEDENNSDNSDSSYDVNIQNGKRKLKTNGYAKPEGSEENFKYISDDSDQDCYTGYLETDDLEGETPALSPDGRILRRKNSRLKNGHDKSLRSPTFFRNDSSNSPNEFSDARGFR